MMISIFRALFLVWVGCCIAAACPVAFAQDSPEGYPQDQAAVATAELLDNPTFLDDGRGWVFKEAEIAELTGAADQPILHLKGIRPELKSWSHAGTTIASAPTSRRLFLRCRALGTSRNQTMVINAFGYKGKNTLTAKFTEEVTFRSPGNWQLAETSYVLPEGTERFAVWMINPSGFDIWVYEAHLTAGPPGEVKLETLDGPGVLFATAGVAVKSIGPGAASPDEAGGRVTFAIPGTYRGQVPLTFDLVVDPPEALESFQWRLRDDGINWLCDVDVKPPEQGVGIRWESLVLVGRAEDLRPNDGGDPGAVPAAAAPWMESTACIQSKHPDIRARATGIADKANQRFEDFVRGVIGFIKGHRVSGDPPESQDALAALHGGGSRAGRANLAAALLRARGVPSRLVTILPTWSGPEFAHWLIEYWHPGLGWIAFDPTLGKLYPQLWTRVVLGVVMPADEEEAFSEGVTKSGLMKGLPELCVFKISESLERQHIGADKRTGILGNQAVCEKAIEGDADTMAALFDQALVHFERLSAACMDGRIDSDDALAIRQALNTGDAAVLRSALAETGND